MGYGYEFECRNCQHKYSISLGSGFLYPEEYRKEIKKISAGNYGAEWKQAFEKNPYTAINAESVLYICSSCNAWECVTDITLYIPNNPASIAYEYEKKNRRPDRFVSSWDLKDRYHVLKRHYHKCKKCGKRMHKASKGEEQSLCCPKCGTANESIGEFCWD